MKKKKATYLCFGCDKRPQKYVDGLCEKCNQIATIASVAGLIKKGK